jgi:CMP-N-acetylneuraminic acid synthetase
LKVDSNGVIKFHVPDGPNHSQRQTIPPYYHRNGICYAATRKSLVDNSNIINKDALGVIIDRNVVNIDEPIDLEWAEFLINKNFKLKKNT